MKLLLDMNLSPRWATVLADAGLEATHWSDIGLASAPDAEIAAFAASEGMVVVTNDLDFGALLSMSGGPSPSVVQIRADNLSPEAIGAVVVNALRQLRAELDSGALVTIESDRARLRLLPIARGEGH